MLKKFTTVQKELFLTQIETNPWNPNVQEDAIFKSLKKSIEDNGFTCPILVRELEGDNKYQIIDGEHRYKACKELGYVEIKCENIGVISDEIAKMLTIALNNIRGQDDLIKRAQILKTLNDGQRSLFPWTKEQMENELKLLDFNWDKFNKTEESEIPKESIKETICFVMTSAQKAMLREAIVFTGKMNDSDALIDILVGFLELRTSLEKFGDLVDKNRIVQCKKEE